MNLNNVKKQSAPQVVTPPSTTVDSSPAPAASISSGNAGAAMVGVASSAGTLTAASAALPPHVAMAPGVFPCDPATAALLMNPHVAAHASAFYLAATAAAQHQHQQMQMHPHHHAQHHPQHQQQNAQAAALAFSHAALMASSQQATVSHQQLPLQPATHSSPLPTSTQPEPQATVPSAPKKKTLPEPSTTAKISSSPVPLAAASTACTVSPCAASTGGTSSAAAIVSAANSVCSSSSSGPASRQCRRLDTIASGSGSEDAASVTKASGAATNSAPAQQIKPNMNTNLRKSKTQELELMEAEARRREEKKAAKRIANRKSASTSRARKKAFVEELTRTNARLRRHALILSLLPDLVMAISPKGVISFCSAQVERILRYKCEELDGAPIDDVLVPASRETVRRLIDKLIVSDNEGMKAASDTKASEQDYESNGGLTESGGHPVSCRGCEEMSSISGSTEFCTVVPDATRFCRKADDEVKDVCEAASGKAISDPATKLSQLSSLTYESLMKHSENQKSSVGKASFTELNSVAGRREDGMLENASDDSGYRPSSSDSFPSRQDSDTTDDRLHSGNSALAPTCNVGLLRNNRTAIWCEVTASVKTISLDMSSSMSSELNPISREGVAKKGGRPSSVSSSSSGCKSKVLSNGEVDANFKEILLCLRPIRYSREKLGKEISFRSYSRKSRKRDSQKLLENPQGSREGSPQLLTPNDTNSTESVTVSSSGSSNLLTGVKRTSTTRGPPKKRSFVLDESGSNEHSVVQKKEKTTVWEKSVVESLIMMSSR